MPAVLVDFAGFAGGTASLHTEDAGCAGCAGCVGSAGAAVVWAESGGVAAGGAGHFDERDVE